MVKNLPAMQESQDQFLGQEDILEGMATHSSILTQKIPWAEEFGGLQSMRSQRVGHFYTTEQLTHFNSIYAKGSPSPRLVATESAFYDSSFIGFSLWTTLHSRTFYHLLFYCYLYIYKTQNNTVLIILSNQFHEIISVLLLLIVVGRQRLLKQISSAISCTSRYHIPI